MSLAIKYIYINIKIGYGNKTIKFINTTKFCGLQIDNISNVSIHRRSAACFAMVAVAGLMRTDTLYFHFTVSFWVSFWGSFLGSKNIFTSKANHYSIGMFKEKSFVGNYVSNSLHLKFGNDYIFLL